MNFPSLNLHVNKHLLVKFGQNLYNLRQLTFLSYLLIACTYVIDHYNPSVRITAQLLTPLMLCALICIHQRRDLEFNVDSERQIFEKLFHGRLITDSFCQKFAERTTAQLLTSLRLCALICIHERRDLQFNVGSERQIFEKHFHGSFITDSFCQKFAERKWPKKYFFSYFVLMPDLVQESGHTTYQTMATSYCTLESKRE